MTNSMLLAFPTAKPESSLLDNKTHVTDDLMPKGVALYDYDAGSSSEISFKVSQYTVVDTTN